MPRSINRQNQKTKQYDNTVLKEETILGQKITDCRTANIPVGSDTDVPGTKGNKFKSNPRRQKAQAKARAKKYKAQNKNK